MTKRKWRGLEALSKFSSEPQHYYLALDFANWLAEEVICPICKGEKSLVRDKESVWECLLCNGRGKVQRVEQFYEDVVDKEEITAALKNTQVEGLDYSAVKD